ncbi:hypothetical protein [Humibacter ginsenosidimutans]|uniref:DUF4276 family protein n=1 Tax=Humibacter ginsenosidimutans TaxID=2599293 RepID=A0A5B8M520_9MICO|nr:hypothetical protein [Humibacter ginsenosidimutans]QDZ15443.1 hypothetical protein FPZ11_12370 [Humibacter ginsenosidimutans]
MINVAVEGQSDIEVARAVVGHSGHVVGKIVVTRGKTNLDPKIVKYAAAAVQTPWIVFRDSDGECPVGLRSRLFPSIPRDRAFLLRIAHTMTEAWLLADREGFADYFGVAISHIPRDVEGVKHAKVTLLHLCASSRLRAIRREVVSDDGHIGPLYVLHLNTFASQSWNIPNAAMNSPSLARSLQRIAGLSAK